jgi:16S rRNA (cytosine967-C5)-methyltransferase
VLHSPLSRLDPTVLEVLRLGAYQLLAMRSVPAYAAVSQAVEQAREAAGDGAAALVNAVLRNLRAAGDGPARFPDAAADPLGFLETWGSHPRWLLERWLARWPLDEVRALVEANNRRPETYLVPLEVEPAEAIRILAAAGLEAEAVGEGTACVRLAEGVSPRDALAVLPRAIVQDPAAHLVTRYADVPEGTKVADLCAAPGGKALPVAHRSAYTLAADRSATRLRMLRDNARRTGRFLGLVVADALRPPLRGVDVVLLDVPCTGTGTLQRRPDARWRLRPAALEALVRVQGRMLDAAAELLPPGGLLVYSTCSLEPEENEIQLEAFLARHAEFSVEPTGAVPGQYLDAFGRLLVLPQRTGFDGAFAARLRRAA